MTRRRTARELRAMAYTLADEVETRAQPLIAKGMQRDRAIMLATMQMSGHLKIIYA